LSQTIAATGQQLGRMGVEEMDEGALRLAAADAAAGRAGELAAASEMLGVRGVAEVAVAQSAADAARQLAAEGIAEVAVGAAGLGAAETLEAVSEQLDEAATT
jgi:hypothetical protein